MSCRQLLTNFGQRGRCISLAAAVSGHPVCFRERCESQLHYELLFQEYDFSERGAHVIVIFVFANPKFCAVRVGVLPMA